MPTRRGRVRMAYPRCVCTKGQDCLRAIRTAGRPFQPSVVSQRYIFLLREQDFFKAKFATADTVLKLCSKWTFLELRAGPKFPINNAEREGK